ncbi:hypothetical protein [Bacillus fungorum]|uniref:Uncharacterized protein n=1 Tax=Bacillus fungorum TaxID=2039284 RepID=A0A2G6Q6H0_9BACI|nr:hypothetical protein [Bacillus fungorum]PIE92355.1 hypothetical protein CO726_27060 [Bacillus fungorum]
MADAILFFRLWRKSLHSLFLYRNFFFYVKTAKEENFFMMGVFENHRDGRTSVFVEEVIP